MLGFRSGSSSLDDILLLSTTAITLFGFVQNYCIAAMRFKLLLLNFSHIVLVLSLLVSVSFIRKIFKRVKAERCYTDVDATKVIKHGKRAISIFFIQCKLCKAVGKSSALLGFHRTWRNCEQATLCCTTRPTGEVGESLAHIATCCTEHEGNKTG